MWKNSEHRAGGTLILSYTYMARKFGPYFFSVRSFRWNISLWFDLSSYGLFSVVATTVDFLFYFTTNTFYMCFNFFE